MTYGVETYDPIRVLFIDDDPGFARLVRKALERQGHSVVHVATGAEGEERLAAGGIDVIALDHTLEGETGFDILARLGPRGGGRPPVVYVTAAVDARTAVEAMRAGADDYVIKDASSDFFELLVVAIEKALERWRMGKMRERAEEELRTSRDRAETLLREVNHRIANSLGLAAAMVRMQASAIQDPGAVGALLETRRRIVAIAAVHRRLYVSEKFGQVEIDDYLAHLTQELEESLRDADHNHAIALSAQKFSVSIEKAVSLGVIVGELVTNAFKYAYQREQKGEVRVRVGRGGNGDGVLTVEDDGCGYDTAAPCRGTGLGSKILAGMAQSLGATYEQDAGPEGVRTRLAFKIS
jgi:two-component sensor histidine kinase